ncbi:MAG: dockerin type I repeat-containing protein [Clostridia bacterium]|nr:dockerin type I repeat-containing protein [Clostridia bacterium]
MLALLLLCVAGWFYSPRAAAAEAPTDLPAETAEETLTDTEQPSEEELQAYYNAERVLGDVDADGGVSASDARLALRLAVGLEQYPAGCAARNAADVTADGSITAEDARRILRAAVGLELLPHAHTYCHAYCTVCGQIDPLHYPLAFQTDFERILYETSHPLLMKSSSELPANTGSLLERAYYRIGKWCCYYTIHHVFRPALQAAGYSKAKIDQIAPTNYDTKLLSDGLLVSKLFSLHVPSLLMDYYLTHPQYCQTYILHEFMDDVVSGKLIKRGENADDYTPEVGDILFMSNKERTYVDGYPTVDHTAQIIQVYADGSFFCTEGSITNTEEENAVPRVRERMYFYDAEAGTYRYRYDDVCVVLLCVKPDLSK